jgi:hypothetical protein
MVCTIVLFIVTSFLLLISRTVKRNRNSEETGAIHNAVGICATVTRFVRVPYNVIGRKNPSFQPAMG